MLRLTTSVVLATLLVMGASSCTDALGPDSFMVLVSAPDDGVLVGDTVVLLGVAHNSTGSEIRGTTECGPGIRLEMQDPNGAPIDLYEGILQTCELRDSHIFLPGETDAEEVTWVPEQPGTYSVESTVSIRSGQLFRSDMVLIRVVES